MKPAYSTLRCKGLENVGYIDDTYLKGSTFHACETNVSTTVKLFTDSSAYGKNFVGGVNIICPNETCWSQMHKMILS